MDEHPDKTRISFFRLAEQYEMSRGRRQRWRERRDAWPSRRHRRGRSRRKKRTSSRHYLPMKVDSRAASRGIRTRLAGAIGSAVLTVICLLSIVFAPEITLGSVLPLAVGLGSLGLSIALTMSARREEIVHQVAGQLNEDQGAPSMSVGADSPTRLEDGHLEEQRMMQSLSSLESEVTGEKL